MLSYLTSWIERTGMARADIVNQLGSKITEERVRAWEAGLEVPSTKELLQLAYIFNCDAALIVDLEDHELPPCVSDRARAAEV